jgi:hypothetical protein
MQDSPWGPVDSVEEVAHGVDFVSTPGHGGYHLGEEQQAAVVKRFPHFTTFAGGPWYEEDCDWAIVCFVFPHLFPPEAYQHALNMARSLSTDSGKWAEVVATI